MMTRLRQLLPQRRWARWSLAAVVLLGVVWVVAPKLVAPYVRGKLQAMVASRVKAELRMGPLTYLPPFGVRVRDVRLVAREEGAGEVDLVKFARLDLRLARLPFGEGPLVIERVDVQQPEVRLVVTEHGLVGRGSFGPQTQPAPQQQQSSMPSPAAAAAKLSDMFELRHMAIWDGKIVLEDRTRPGSKPVVWSDLSASTDTNPTSKSAYTFDLRADHKGVAAVTSAGTFDLDTLHVALRDARVTIRINPEQPTSALPAQVQSVLSEYRAAGTIDVNATAEGTLRDIPGATFDATVTVDEASAHFPQSDTPLDRLTLRLNAKTLAPGREGPVEVRLESFQAESGGTRVGFAANPAPVLRLDRAARSWALRDVAGAVELASSGKPGQSAGRVAFEARAAGPFDPPAGQSMVQAADYHATLRPAGVRVQPPKFPLPLEDLGGRGALVELRPGVVLLKDLSARYGGDVIRLDEARVPLPPDLYSLKHSFAIEEIAGRIDFRTRPNPKYPGQFGKVVKALSPGGGFDIGGGSYVHLNRVPPADDGTPPRTKRRADWYFGVSTDNGSFTLGERQVRLVNMTGDATVSNLLIDVTRLDCAVFGGRGVASGKIVPARPFPVEGGRVALREIDLAEVARTLQPDQPNEKLVGRGFLNMTFAGALTGGEKEKSDDPEEAKEDAAEEAEEAAEKAEDGEGPDPPAPPVADVFRATGEFEVIQGHFWTLPVLGAVADQAKKGDLTVGEAAGVFRVADRVLTLENAAVSAPALGLMGSGTIGFDKSLDLRIVAAPLGDWRDHMKQARLPLISDVAAEVVGGVQRVLNAATSAMLYQFHVTGTTADPKLDTVPAPILNDPNALLLGRMLDEKRKQRLIDSMRPPPKAATN